MAASLTTFTGRPNAFSKSKPTHPVPRLCGSADGRCRITEPGYPIDTTSYRQSPASFLTPETICLAVNVGPDANLRDTRFPETRIFTWVPPTSTTSTFMARLSQNAVAKRPRRSRFQHRNDGCRSRTVAFQSV